MIDWLKRPKILKAGYCKGNKEWESRCRRYKIRQIKWFDGQELPYSGWTIWCKARVRDTTGFFVCEKKIGTKKKLSAAMKLAEAHQAAYAAAS